MDTSHTARLARARTALEGLSVGDALGGFFEFGSYATLARYVQERRVPAVEVWRWTDDTNMTLSVYNILRQYQALNQDALALDFAKHFDRGRGYGMSIRGWVQRVLDGQPWYEVNTLAFGGTGSYGNGGAMRVAPVGAYFADDMDAVVENARKSAEITHAHTEGITGAMGVAVAAALACRLRGQPPPDRPAFIDLILPHIPDSIVREKTRHARDLPSGATVELAVSALGNGSQISAQDTVPFCLWCAGEQLAAYEDALWLTASAGGDVDTTCAIVGGIVACYVGDAGIPAAWRAAREPLPEWAMG
ncbi:MAG: ADP-ribosylglycohydrolase family protein [Chloroflexota bacterium]|nr:ADP-ribosylglycohydrolase family protein [Chloroflexota bacterium]